MKRHKEEGKTRTQAHFHFSLWDKERLNCHCGYTKEILISLSISVIMLQLSVQDF